MAPAHMSIVLRRDRSVDGYACFCVVQKAVRRHCRILPKERKRGINMKLSISNIAWNAQEDSAVYSMMKKYGYTGLEIAPTRIIEQAPYENLKAAESWRETLDFEVPSMQSIWFGKTQKLFGGEADRQELLDYTKAAVDFAKTVRCGNLVFGSPKNRALPDTADKKLRQAGVAFFRELGDYAAQNGTAIGMEANPAIYSTNYINTTQEALNLIREVGSNGFLLNLDVGTMIENRESVELLEGYAAQINHVHISEPFLKPVVISPERRQLHGGLAAFLRENDYQGYVSVEMGRTEELSVIEEILAYVKEMFA